MTGCWHIKNEDGNEVCGSRPEPQPKTHKPPAATEEADRG